MATITPQNLLPTPAKLGRLAAGWVALATSVMMAFAAPAMAQHPEGPGPGPGGLWAPKRMARMLDGINATPEQRQQIGQITQSLMPELKSMRQAQRALMEKNLALLSAPVIDEAQIEQNRQQMLAQHAQLSQRMSAAFIQMAKVLTPEQRTQLAQHMKDRMARQGRHPMARRGHPGHLDAPGAPAQPER